jgi:hypothetical protein
MPFIFKIQLKVRQDTNIFVYINAISFGCFKTSFNVSFQKIPQSFSLGFRPKKYAVALKSALAREIF